MPIRIHQTNKNTAWGVASELRRLLVWEKQLSGNLFFKALSLLLETQSCLYSDKRRSSKTGASAHHRRRHKQVFFKSLSWAWSQAATNSFYHVWYISLLHSEGHHLNSPMSKNVLLFEWTTITRHFKAVVMAVFSQHITLRFLHVQDKGAAVLVLMWEQFGYQYRVGFSLWNEVHQ